MTKILYIHISFQFFITMLVELQEFSLIFANFRISNAASCDKSNSSMGQDTLCDTMYSQEK